MPVQRLDLGTFPYLHRLLKRYITPAVVIAALGYFVDIYDLVLFSMVRERSLRSLGLPEGDLLQAGATLFNWQMIGMLIGGLLWGILADKRGRLSTLYGSIILYSLANIANGMVDSVGWYAAWRLVAGIGLAGELGAGITLVAETSPKASRGISTAIVAGVGLTGAVLAGFMAPHFDWRTLYYIGGGLGFLLLALRISASESGLFHQTKEKEVARGNFFMLFRNAPTLLKYLRCVLVGLPVWFIVGILMTFSSEFGKALNIEGGIVPSTAVACCYGGQVLGDLSSGLLSQLFKNRKRVMLLYLIAGTGLTIAYRFLDGISPTDFYVLSFFLGISAGYWILFTTMSSEQFGTNIRGTVTTTVPNFVRGSLVPMNILFLTLKEDLSILDAALYTGLIVYAIAMVAWWGMQDTFHKELDYVE